jgi:endo-1,4-beta-mannosidase
MACDHNPAEDIGLGHFITRDGHQLKNGNELFRFAGFNAPELHRIEDDQKGVCKNDTRGWGQYFKWPTADEQENWIKALTLSGHKATRIYVLSVEDTNDKACERETHILKPVSPEDMPQLNEKAMRVFDRMVALSEKYDLRLIIPFIDHWEWWGGRKQLAAFYGETEDDFYLTESKTYQAYLAIIKQVITRKNTITGRYYYEEKSIMAWETGNELKASTPEFVAKTAAYIKSLAPQQLVVDGNYLSILEHSLTDENIDIINNHFYTINDNNKPQTIKDDLAKINGKKVYLVGEFGLKPVQGLEDILKTAVDYDHNGAQAAGVFIWGYRGHKHNGGHYWHKEGGPYFSYHLPGFSENNANEEQAVVKIVREAQAKLAGLKSVPKLPKPDAPKLRNISKAGSIKWMGAATGRTYRIERQINDAAWQVIANAVSDGKNQFNDSDILFKDDLNHPLGTKLTYRVIAINESGESPASNTLTIKINDKYKPFITVKNGQFIKQGKPYYFVGTNYWYGPLLGAKQGNRERLITELDQLSSLGVNNLRILVGAEGGQGSSTLKPALQTKPGVYNESLLIGLDYLLNEMGKRNMEAVLYLNNNWIWSGGMSRYLAWNGYGEVPNPFLPEVPWDDYMQYTAQFHGCEPCKNQYNQHIKTIISRTNSINGKAYSEDPTIMSWQLANEPRVFTTANQDKFIQWVDQSVDLIASLAPNQLISTGNEGKAGSTNSLTVFEAVHQNNNIDYLTMHMWPKNWMWYDINDKNKSVDFAINQANKYMDEHLLIAKRMNKPIVMEEFGFPRNQEQYTPGSATTLRDKFFKAMFQRIVGNKNTQGNLAGMNFWAYGGVGKANANNHNMWQQGDDYLGDPPQEPQGLNTVFSTDINTLGGIKQFADILK